MKAYMLQNGGLMVTLDTGEAFVSHDEPTGGIWNLRPEGGVEAPAKPRAKARKRYTKPRPRRAETASGQKTTKRVLWRFLPKPRAVKWQDLELKELDRIRKLLKKEGSLGARYGGENLAEWPLQDDDYLTASQIIAIMGWEERAQAHSIVRTWRLRGLLKPKRRGKLFVYRASNVLAFMLWFRKYEEMRQRGVTVT